MKKIHEPILKEPKAAYSSVLQCLWLSWRSVDDWYLALRVPEGQKPNFDGVISVAEAICPPVYRIDLYCGEVYKASYIRGDGRRDVWAAFPSYSPALLSSNSEKNPT